MEQRQLPGWFLLSFLLTSTPLPHLLLFPPPKCCHLCLVCHDCRRATDRYHHCSKQSCHGSNLHQFLSYLPPKTKCRGLVRKPMDGLSISMDDIESALPPRIWILHFGCCSTMLFFYKFWALIFAYNSFSIVWINCESGFVVVDDLILYFCCCWIWF